MLTLFPNEPKTYGVHKFPLGIQNLFFSSRVGYLGQAKVFGCWVLGFGIAFCVVPVQQGTFGMA